MKNIKKLISLLVLLAAVLCASLMLTGCDLFVGGGGNGGDNGDKGDEPHTHSYVNYVYNNDATCVQDGTETAKCEYCDETNTRKSSTHPATGEHKFNGDTCEMCGFRLAQGLDYSEIKEGDVIVGYSVIGIGNVSDTEILIPDTYNGKPVMRIGDKAFYGSGLTEIIIPNSVTDVGEYVFMYCTSLRTIKIPNSVTNIGKGVFLNCFSLSSAEISNNLKNIAQGLFGSCSKLTSIEIPSGVTNIENSAFIYCKSLVNIEIPANVVSIGDNAFGSCESITSIDISANVQSIGDSAFRGCKSLISIEVADGNSVYHSDGNCLIETASKKLIAGCKNSVIPNDGSVVSINVEAFYGCDGLTNIEIPSSVSSIGDYAFYVCDSLTGVNIPNGVTSIGEGAFMGCDKITDIVIPISVESIGDLAFRGCKSLTSIEVADGNSVYHSDGNCLIETASKTLIAGCNNSVIPNDGSVISIEKDAFWGCRELTDIVIPNYVTSIGEGAFSFCVGLESIEIPSSVINIGDQAFFYCNNLTIYCEVIEQPIGWSSGWNSSNCPVVWDYKNQ